MYDSAAYVNYTGFCGVGMLIHASISSINLPERHSMLQVLFRQQFTQEGPSTAIITFRLLARCNRVAGALQFTDSALFNARRTVHNGSTSCDHVD
jgi:hypothetical protein